MPRRKFTSKVEWNDDHIVPLLEAYKPHRCLWSVEDMENANSKQKNAALNDILEKLHIENLDGKELQMKFSCLRQSYYYDRRNVLKARKDNRIYKSPRFWYPLADSFLRENLKNEEGESPDSTAPKILQKYNQLHMVCPSKFPQPLENDNPHNVSSTSTTNTAGLTPFVDQFDVFGKSVAMTLKCMPVPEALMLQTKLQAAVTECRIAFLNGDHFMPSSSSNACSSVQDDTASKSEPNVKIKKEKDT